MTGLSLKLKLTYAAGMAGWSIMINLINVILVYLYLPPAGSGIPVFITQVVIFGVFNAVALITAGGRLADALIDPLIAQYSDSSTNPRGRRIPIMRMAILPAIVFCFLVFYPLSVGAGPLNMVWLASCLVLFYAASTAYIIPYHALLPELAHTPAAKVTLATWQSFGYVVGIGLSSNAFNLAAWLRGSMNISQLGALQVTVLLLLIPAAICMLITTQGISENRYAVSVQSAVPMRVALKRTLSNYNFRLFIVADFSYFIAVTIIVAGLLYFITVLLALPETMGNRLMITMVVCSVLLYPVINRLADKLGKRIIVVVSFFILALVFCGVAVLGLMPVPPATQIYLLIVLAAIPLATLNILPNAILAEIITRDRELTGENREAMFFAVRYFFVKVGQTIGIALFAMLLLYGKDQGNDVGIRLNGVAGAVLCITAAVVFSKFNEPRPAR